MGIFFCFRWFIGVAGMFDCLGCIWSIFIEFLINYFCFRFISDKHATAVAHKCTRGECENRTQKPVHYRVQLMTGWNARHLPSLIHSFIIVLLNINAGWFHFFVCCSLDCLSANCRDSKLRIWGTQKKRHEQMYNFFASQCTDLMKWSNNFCGDHSFVRICVDIRESHESGGEKIVDSPYGYEIYCGFFMSTIKFI